MSEHSKCFGKYNEASNLCFFCADDNQCETLMLANAKKVEEDRHKQTVKGRLQQLRELVCDEDIPSPTVPEYVEHHESIQKILRAIDELILEVKI